jgi:aminoglycoside phosphotransferase (APT) family kinase protein
VHVIAEGRTAEIVAVDGDDQRVVKLDKPEWNGLSAFESGVIERVAARGIPVARSHGTITLDGRCGMILDRIGGESLESILLGGSVSVDEDGLAREFVALQGTINAVTIDGLPDLVARLGDEITRGGLAADVVDRLVQRLLELDDGERRLCHFDYHPGNVLISPSGWVVVDWLGAASGPPAADFARTLLLLGYQVPVSAADFVRGLRRHGLARTSLEDPVLDDWVRVVAAARLAEGFDGEYREWLTSIAEGKISLGAV